MSYKTPPSLLDLEHAVPLGGFSGASVVLLRLKDGTNVVRKSAQLASQSSALRAQASRQTWLRLALMGKVNVAEIINDGFKDGLYWFDMHYVEGRDTTTHLIYGSFEDAEIFTKRLQAMLVELASLPSFRKPPDDWAFVDALTAKLNEINGRTNGRFRHLVAPLAELIASAPDQVLAPSFAHGDLTFENILIDRHGQLCLIDPIDSPFEHRWMDWTKLFQDCEGRWHLHRRRELPLSVSWRLRESLIQFVGLLDPGYRSIHYLLLGLTFARILPYAETDSDIAFVTERIALFSARAAHERLKGQL